MRRRQGFTITELLVAMALIVFIMYILAEAFSAGSGAFRNLKAVGDMNERLRTTTTVLRRYLSADHFEGRKRLSDSNFWQSGPPNQGFFRIWQGSDSVSEGNDLKTQLALEADLQRKAGSSEDAREGVLAFREKRAPRYQGR